MSIESTVESMTGLLPVVVTAGIAMKFAERVFPQQLVSTKKSKKKRDVYSQNYYGSFGDFSNIGY